MRSFYLGRKAQVALQGCCGPCGSSGLRSSLPLPLLILRCSFGEAGYFKMGMTDDALGVCQLYVVRAATSRCARVWGRQRRRTELEQSNCKHKRKGKCKPCLLQYGGYVATNATVILPPSPSPSPKPVPTITESTGWLPR